MTKPPVALAISFIDCINRSDLAALSDLLSTDHRLEVFDEEPLIGKQANTLAWNGYFEKFSSRALRRRAGLIKQSGVAMTTSPLTESETRTRPATSSQSFRIHELRAT